MKCPYIIKKSLFAPGIPDKERIDPINLKDITRLVIQKHKAKTDHYDFRLRQGDLAQSWASKHLLGEKDKILMVRQPGHLASYMDFQGTIPSGYGAGTVKKVYDKLVAISHADDKKIKLVLPEGNFAMIKMKGENPNWLMIKQKPIINAVQSKPKYKSIKPEQIDFSDDKQVMQPKIDGAHSIIELRPGKQNKIYSYRNRKKDNYAIDHSQQVTKLRDAKVPQELKNTMLRGELYAKDRQGKALPPEEIGGILNSGVVGSLLKQKQKGELIPTLFDIVQYRGKNVENLPYREKYKILKAIEEVVPEMKIADTYFNKADKEKIFNQIKSGKFPDTKEGVVLWNLNKPGGDPTKVKFKKEFDVVIRDVFKGESRTGKSPFAGGFTFSYKPHSKIVGKVGTGFSQKLRKEMWQHPERFKGLVARVNSQQKYPSGALRMPVYRGLHVEKNL